jgi:hypothetical protein
MMTTNTHVLFTPIPLRTLRLPVLGVCNLAPYMNISVGPIAAVGVTRLARVNARHRAFPYHVPSAPGRRCTTPPGHREVRFQTESQTSSRRTTPTPRSDNVEDTLSDPDDDDEGSDTTDPAALVPIPKDQGGRVLALGRKGDSIMKWSRLSNTDYTAAKVSSSP